MRASGRFQPVRQLQQIFGHRPKGADLLLRLAFCPRHDQAGRDTSFMHIQTATALIDDVQTPRLLSLSLHHRDDRAECPPLVEILACVLPFLQGATIGGALGHSGPTGARARSTRNKSTSAARIVYSLKIAESGSTIFIPRWSLAERWTTGAKWEGVAVDHPFVRFPRFRFSSCSLRASYGVQVGAQDPPPYPSAEAFLPLYLGFGRSQCGQRGRDRPIPPWSYGFAKTARKHGSSRPPSK